MDANTVKSPILFLDLKKVLEEYHIAQQKTINIHLNDGFFYKLPGYIC